MSRCFPFPPPGYVNKARPVDSNFIIKEKHKKKKHKDKKDKDKKERSERKDKERTEGKHKEDKDRKRKKHKEKKDKKKDKQKSSEEKNILGLVENPNGEKLSPSNKPGNGVEDYRVLVELGKRVRNDDGARDNQTVQKTTHAHCNIKYNREPNTLVNGQILRVDARSSENGRVEKFSGEKRLKVDNGFLQAEMVEKRNEGKETNELGNSNGEADERKNEDREKNKKEDKKRKKEKEKEKVKEKSKERIDNHRSSDGNFLQFCGNNPSDLLKGSWDSQGKLPKLKEPISNGFLRDNGTRADNMSRPTLSSRQAGQNGSSDFHPIPNTAIHVAVKKQVVVTNEKVNGKLLSSQPAIKNVTNKEPGQTANNSPAEHIRASNKNHVVSNGFISSHSLVENGRKTARPNSIDKTFDSQRPVIDHEMNNKDVRKNGTIEGKNDISPIPPPIVKAKEKAGTYMKPPHPDLKYLNQILTVPKLESPQFNDDANEWLFGRKDAKKPKLGSCETEQTKQVWSEAIQIEYADVIALPYVIPY